MPEHLIERQLQGYRDRTLALGEMVAVDTHLGGCPQCRSELAQLADKTSTASVIAGIDQARYRHLSFEQMDDWVEDRLDPAGRELVMAHIGACSPCARQLIAYQEYAPVMSAPIGTVRVAAAQAVEQKKASFWSFLKRPQYALGAAAVVAFFVITPLTRHSAPEQSGAAILAPTSRGPESVVEKTTPLMDEAVELDTLPDSIRPGVKALMNAPESAPKPAVLKGLESTDGGVLEYPFSEVVPETQPVLQWKAFGASYNVSLYDSRNSLISRKGGVKETRWIPPSALARDQVYTWEVESGGRRYRGTFRVLGEHQQSEMQQVRGSHLVMGAAYEELGMLSAAKREFEAIGSQEQLKRLAELKEHRQ